MKSAGIFTRAEITWSVVLLGFVLVAEPIRADQVEVSDLTLVGIAELDGVTYVSLFDARNGEHFLPSTKAPCDGLELMGVSADESATIRQNGRVFLLRWNWPATIAGTNNDAVQPSVAAQDISLPVGVETTAPKPPAGAKLPLVFQTGDLAKLNLTDNQQAAITRLRQQFIAAVGSAAGSTKGTGVTPSDAATTPAPGTTSTAPEATFQNWLTAQEESDAEFVMLFGQEAFNLSQMKGPSGASP